MTRADRAYLIAMCAIIGGAFAYATCDFAHWPRLTYLPLTGQLTFARTQAIKITYAGTVAWGAGGALCGALVGALLCRLAARRMSPRLLRLFGAWAITALVLAGSYFTWNEWPW